MDKIAIFYGHAASNLGDLAINNGTYNLIRGIFPTSLINFIFLDVNNKDFIENAFKPFKSDALVKKKVIYTEQYDILSISNNPKIFFDICDVTDYDLIIVPSGEFLFSTFKNENIKNMFWRSIPCIAAKLLNIKLVILPCTYGPFEKYYSQKIANLILSESTKFAVREKNSISVLQKTITKNKIDLLLDSAFFLENKSDSFKGRKNRIIGFSIRSSKIGIRLSNKKLFSDKGIEKNEDIAFEFFLRICQKILQETKHKIYFFIQTRNDIKITNQIYNQLQELDAVERLKIFTPNDVNDYLENLSIIDLMISNRFHALILSLINNKNIIGISDLSAHGHKVKGLLSTFDINHQFISLDQKSLYQNINIAFQLINKEEQNTTEINKTIIRMKSETREWFKKQVISEHYFEDNFFEHKVYLDYFALKIINERSYRKLTELNIKNLTLENKLQNKINQLDLLKTKLLEFQPYIINNIEELNILHNKIFRLNKKLKKSKNQQYNNIFLIRLIIRAAKNIKKFFRKIYRKFFRKIFRYSILKLKKIITLRFK